MPMQDVAQVWRLRRGQPLAVDTTRWVTIATFFLGWQALAVYNAAHQVFNPVFLPVLAYTVDGVKSVNPLLIRSAYSLGASEMQIFRRVVLKSALPNIFVGMRVSLALSFSALVVAEMIGADAGLGYLIIDSRNFFRMANMFLAASLIGVEYTLFSLLLGRVEARLFRWRKGGYAHALERSAQAGRGSATGGRLRRRASV